MMAVSIVRPGTAELGERPSPRPRDGELLVEVTYAAVCSTDRKMVGRGQPVGRIPGHEVAGRLSDGRIVGVHPDVGCGSCARCASGETIRCLRRQAIGIDRDGGFAEQLVVPEAHAVAIDDIDEPLIPFLEPLACTLHAARRLGAQPGESAVVLGAGAMGILAMWALQSLGLEVHVCQRGERRRSQAMELGAHGVMGPDDDPGKLMKEPPQVVLVTAPGPEPLEWALRHVAEGGRVHAFAGSPQPVPVDANVVHYRHLTLVGGTGSGLSDYRQGQDLVREGAIDLARLPRTQITLDALPGALSGPPEGDALRSVVRIGRWAA